MNFKLGLLGQFQAESIEDPAADSQINNLFVRRLRLMFGGQVTKNVTFFVETDSPNLGKTLAGGTNLPGTMILQDAYAEFKVTDAFALDAGLMFVPFSRNYLQSAASLLPIDYGAYTYAQSGPTQSSTGRDTGFQAKGYVLDNHLEYRIGAFQGARDTASHRAFRYAGRVQYNLLDPEVGFFYTGSYLGKKKVVSVGGAFDVQDDYHAYDLDVFVDHPLGSGALTGQFDYNWFDGGTTLPALPRPARPALRAGISHRRGQADSVRADCAPQRGRDRCGGRDAHLGRCQLLVGRPQREHQGRLRANCTGRRRCSERLHDSASGVLFLSR